MLSNHSVGGRLKKSFRKLVYNLSSKLCQRSFSGITSTTTDSNESMVHMQFEPSVGLHVESASESEAENTFDEDSYVDTSLDSSASSGLTFHENGSVQSLSSMRSFASSVATGSSNGDTSTRRFRHWQIK